ncbi:HAD family hydrolase [Halobacteriales archaeon QS_1_68_44]|nr:MAG: HAD family hydrolase [Halobacteriales archaeon QS_1_68_44]
MSGSGRRYEAVFWDIGGVIVELASVREGYAAFVAELADAHGLDAEAALETWKTTLGEHFRGREGTEYRTAREGYRKATAALFDGEPPADWEDRLDRATSAALRAEEGAIETVKRLADAGVSQAIVSDIDTHEAEDILRAFDVRKQFNHVTTSEAVGYTKPDERTFRDALSTTGLDPGNVLMVGDRYDHDIAGAAAAGIDAAGYGEDAWGPDATYEISDLRKLPDIVGLPD